MRKWIVVAGAVALVACSGKEQMPSDLSADLEIASGAAALELASAPANAAAVVSVQEQTAPRTPVQAPSARAPRPRPSPTPRIQAAPVTTPEQPSEEIQYAAAVPEPRPTENRGLDGMGEDAILTGRPQVVDAGPGPVTRSGGGADIGAILGGIGIAVIRGGVVVGDVHCPPPRRRARNGGVMSLPNQSPGGGAPITVRGITIR